MKTEAPRPIDRVISFALYAGLGITTEVFFTAISDLIISASFEDLSLKGYSYIWMFPIYGSTSILFPFFFGMMKKWPRLARYAFYGVGILFVELIAGFVLEKTDWALPVGIPNWVAFSRLYSIRLPTTLDWLRGYY